jgi:hypothetical protein
MPQQWQEMVAVVVSVPAILWELAGLLLEMAAETGAVVVLEVALPLMLAAAGVLVAIAAMVELVVMLSAAMARPVLLALAEVVVVVVPAEVQTLLDLAAVLDYLVRAPAEMVVRDRLTMVLAALVDREAAMLFGQAQLLRATFMARAATNPGLDFTVEVDVARTTLMPNRPMAALVLSALSGVQVEPSLVLIPETCSYCDQCRRILIPR